VGRPILAAAAFQAALSPDEAGPFKALELWRYPERFLNEPLEPFLRETSSDVGRADLVFKDRHGRFLVIELKRGKLPRGAIGQLLDYFGMMKRRFPEKPVELMVVANVIPPERRLTCESRDIECREIAEKAFRDVAADVGHTFASESSTSRLPSDAPASPPSLGHTDGQEGTGRWSYSRAAQSPADVQDFLSRCDEEGRRFFSSISIALGSHRWCGDFQPGIGKAKASGSG
jgi:hypothetical protein